MVSNKLIIKKQKDMPKFNGDLCFAILFTIVILGFLWSLNKPNDVIKPTRIWSTTIPKDHLFIDFEFEKETNIQCTKVIPLKI